MGKVSKKEYLCLLKKKTTYLRRASSLTSVLV